MRLGGMETIKVDVRIIAATNVDLRRMMEEGKFREDLFYRLHVISIQLPPLRERKDDIPLLVRHFLRKYGEENRKPDAELSPAALDLISEYDWPGNVRELENVIQRAMLFCGGDTIEASHIVFDRPAPSASGTGTVLRFAPAESGETLRFANGLTTLTTDTTHWQVSEVGFSSPLSTPVSMGQNLPGLQIWGAFSPVSSDATAIWAYNADWSTGRVGHAYFVTQISAVPEPATALLWLGGAALLTALRRRPR